MHFGILLVVKFPLTILWWFVPSFYIKQQKIFASQLQMNLKQV